MDRSVGGRHQFTLAALFGLTAVAAAVFALFRWLGLEARTSLFVVAVLVVSLAGAISLVIAIGRYGIENSESADEGSPVRPTGLRPGDADDSASGYPPN